MSALHTIPEVRRGRFGLIALALASSLVFVSCADDDDENCGEGDNVVVNIRLDSIGWIYRTKDTLFQGRVTKNEDSRVSAQTYGWYGTWNSIPSVKSYLLSRQNSYVYIRGRLGLPDTTVYFLLDSISVDPNDSKKGGIRMEFRSNMGYSYYGYNFPDSSTYWNTRGSISCSHPLEAGVSDITSFSCDVATKGEQGTFMHFKLDLTKEHYKYDCSRNGPVAVD